MSDPHDKQAFAEAFGKLDATNEPEAIRRIIDGDESAELLHRRTGQWYALEDGELKQVTHGDEKEAQ